MDIDEQLIKLLNKYNLDENYPEEMQVLRIEKLINDLFESFGEKSVGIYFGGNHTAMLYRILTPENRKKVYAVIDNNATDNSKYPEWNIIKKSSDERKNIDVYIISSYKYDKEAQIELLNEEKVYSIYDYLRSKKIYLCCAFFEYAVPVHSYRDVFVLKNEYKKCSCEEKDRVLRNLIYVCFGIRDFINALKYLNEYIESKFDGFGELIEFRSEFEGLLEQIKEKVRNRKQKDIIINWIDSVYYEDAFNMTIFAGKNGIELRNAYTVIPYTRSVLNAIFSGKYEIGDFDGNISEKYTKNNSEVIRVLEDAGYCFKYIAYPFLYDDVFDYKYLIHYMNIDKKNLISPSSNGCSTKLQWNALRELCDNEKPCCLLIHNLVEGHIPFYHADMEHYVGGDIWSNEAWDYCYDERYRSGVEYIDGQLNWYDQFYGLETTGIYMTDHGPTCDDRNYSDTRSRVALKICNKKLCACGNKVENRLFSYVDYRKLIAYITEPIPERYNQMFSEYVICEALDFYNSYPIEKMKKWIESGNKKMIKHIRRYVQYRAVRTDEDIYIKYAKGPALYYINGDYENNLIDDEQYATRIEFLREKLGENFVDIDSNAKFEHMRELYKIIENKNIPIDW